MSNRQHKFVRGKTHQTNLISFYAKIMAFGEYRKTVAVQYTLFSSFDFDFMWNSLKQGENTRML